MDFQCVRTHITTCGEWKPNTSSGSKTTVRIVSQRFSQAVASSSTAPSSNASNRPGILKASGQGLSLIAGVRRLAAEDSNSNDAAPSSQELLSDAETNDSARRLAATVRNQNLDFQKKKKRKCKETCRKKIQASSAKPQSGRTIAAYLVITFHILRKSIRICDRNLVASQETKWNTSMWILWYGECLCLPPWMPQFFWKGSLG